MTRPLAFYSIENYPDGTVRHCIQNMKVDWAKDAQVNRLKVACQAILTTIDNKVSQYIHGPRLNAAAAPMVSRPASSVGVSSASSPDMSASVSGTSNQGTMIRVRSSMGWHLQL